MVITGNVPHLCIAVFHDSVGNDLDYKPEPVVQLRLGEECIHKGQTAAARRRRGFVLAELLSLYVFNTHHGDPLSPTHRGLSPSDLRQRGAVIALQQRAGLLSPNLETPLGKRCSPCLTRLGFPGQMDRLTSGSGKQELSPIDADGIKVARGAHTSTMTSSRRQCGQKACSP